MVVQSYYSEKNQFPFGNEQHEISHGKVQQNQRGKASTC